MAAHHTDEEAGYQGLMRLAARIYGLEHITCESCLRYALPGAFHDQHYEFVDDRGATLSFHVEIAQNLAQASQYQSHVQRNVLVPPAQVERMLEICQIVPVHLDHLPAQWLDIPGLMVTTRVAQPQRGEPTEQHTLIDGSHRLHRAWRDKRKFYVHILSPQLSELAWHASQAMIQQRQLEAAMGQGTVAEMFRLARQKGINFAEFGLPDPARTPLKKAWER